MKFSSASVAFLMALAAVPWAPATDAFSLRPAAGNNRQNIILPLSSSDYLSSLSGSGATATKPPPAPQQQQQPPSSPWGPNPPTVPLGGNKNSVSSPNAANSASAPYKEYINMTPDSPLNRSQGRLNGRYPENVQSGDYRRMEAFGTFPENDFMRPGPPPDNFPPPQQQQQQSIQPPPGQARPNLVNSGFLDNVTTKQPMGAPPFPDHFAPKPDSFLDNEVHARNRSYRNGFDQDEMIKRPLERAPPRGSPSSYMGGGPTSFPPPPSSPASTGMASPGQSSPSTTESTPEIEQSPTSVGPIIHASQEYFDVSKLKSKGPRANADVGQPHDSTRKLAAIGSFSSGSWWCAAGGWPSSKTRTTTEIFHVFSGFGCLTDMDGEKHFFGPGSTVILPKGWSGRWDVLEDVHKVWFVNNHPNVEERGSPIRAKVTNYKDLVSFDKPSGRGDALYGSSPSSTHQSLYEVGPTDVGSWTCTPGSFAVTSPTSATEGFHILQGTCVLTNADGSARRCTAGDTVVLPKGWTGQWDILETVTKLWVEIKD